ncbi:hypothetical protein FCM35_KLT11800 [Carex littledalei]|uniref:Uncharacterized protein n=1 Tax=Carex littledalei TaxID=544730 RepID=A0A833QIV9_9POAL|nr:hypothetical protein FCM35_KLT11800 [Carex littledalei]
MKVTLRNLSEIALYSRNTRFDSSVSGGRQYAFVGVIKNLLTSTVSFRLLIGSDLASGSLAALNHECEEANPEPASGAW